MSNIPANARASGNFIEHAGGDRIPPRLEQKVLILGESNDLALNIEAMKPYRVTSITQARLNFGENSELTALLTLALTQRPYTEYYGVAFSGSSVEILPESEKEAEEETEEQANTRANYTPSQRRIRASTNIDYAQLFDHFGDTFYTKLVLPFYDQASLLALKELASQRNDPSIHRPIAIFAPSNLSFDDQLIAAQAINSEYIHFVYLENCPVEELSILAVSAVIEMAHLDNEALGRPYKTLPIRHVDMRPDSNYVYAQSDALVKAGSSWLRVDNANQLLIGDMCSTYRSDSEGFSDETWFFSESLANYQAKVFDLDYLLRSNYAQVIFVPDASPTSRIDAVSPNMVKLSLITLINSWAEQALTVNSDQVIQTLQVRFNANNPARMDIQFVDQMSVGGRIFAIQYTHGFNKEAV